jgi:hypothetical protein
MCSAFSHVYVMCITENYWYSLTKPHTRKGSVYINLFSFWKYILPGGYLVCLFDPLEVNIVSGDHTNVYGKPYWGLGD